MNSSTTKPNAKAPSKERLSILEKQVAALQREMAALQAMPYRAPRRNREKERAQLEQEQRDELVRLTLEKLGDAEGLEKYWADKANVGREDDELIRELRERAKLENIPEIPSFIDVGPTRPILEAT